MIKSLLLSLSLLSLLSLLSFDIKPRDYARQIDKTIVESCNIQTFQDTKNEIVYKCIVNKNKNCNIITGYEEYVRNIYICIDNNRSICGIYILITIILFILLLYTNIK